MDLAGGFINPDMGLLLRACLYLHPEIPLVALSSLVHLRTVLPLLVLGGAESCDQGLIHYRNLPHRPTPTGEVVFDGPIDAVICEVVDMIAQIVLLQEAQNRRLIMDPVTDQIDAGKAQGGNLDQGLFHCRIAERIPLL